MKLTPDQDRALKAITKWRKAKTSPWRFTLTGYAGTGKTTLLRDLIEGLEGKTVYTACAPTGKAASVLRAKLPGVRVQTVHQLLYNPNTPGESPPSRVGELEEELRKAKAAGQPTAALRIELQRERDRVAGKPPRGEDKVSFRRKPEPSVSPSCLVIVDEASMVGERMLKDFEALGARVLFVGDDGQLPPVKEGSWFTRAEHDARLTTVVRQALDSPIIRLSVQIREGEVKYAEFKEGACRLVAKKMLSAEEWLSADQILTGSNETRRRINRWFREKLGHVSTPLEGLAWLPRRGEKMICLKNNHGEVPPWINGVQLEVLRSEFTPAADSTFLEARYEEAQIAVPLYPYHIQASYLDNVQELAFADREGMFEADFAYGITVHKSQGSEWPFVIVADDGMRKEDKTFRQQWLYTAATRAKDKLIIAV